MPVDPSLYLSLLLAIPTTATMTFVHEAAKHRKDWVWTPGTVAPLVVLIAFKDIVIVLAYIEIAGICEHSAILAHFTFWVLDASALLLHFAADKLVGPLADQWVIARLAALKDSVATAISHNPDGFEMLTTSLDLADIPIADQQRVLSGLTGKTLHDQAISVIRATGLPIPLQIVKSRQERFK
jgi:hypothetical protein